MKKSPDHRDRTRKERGARLRCRRNAAARFPTGTAVGKAEARRPPRTAGGAGFKPCAPSPCAVYSPAENDIPIINTKFLFSRLDFSLLFLYIIKAVNRGFFE